MNSTTSELSKTSTRRPHKALRVGSWSLHSYDQRTATSLKDLPEDVLRLIFLYLGRPRGRRGEHLNVTGRNLSASLPLARTNNGLLELFYSSLSNLAVHSEAEPKLMHASDSDLSCLLNAAGRYIMRLKLGPLPGIGTETITTVGRSCHNLMALDLTVDDPRIFPALRLLLMLIGPRLKVFRLSVSAVVLPGDSSSSASQMLDAVANYCSNLHQLKLDQVWVDSPQVLLNALQALGTNLSSLGLTRFSATVLTAPVIACIADRCESLEQLSMSCQNGLGRWTVVALALSLYKTLRSLRLGGREMLNGEVLCDFLRHSPNLEDFSFNIVTRLPSQWSHVFDAAFWFSFHQLELHICGLARFNDAHCRAAAATMRQLTHITLMLTPHATDVGIRALCAANYRSLRCLRLECCGLKTQGLKDVANICSQLRGFHLASNRFVTDSGLRAIFEHLRQLETVTLVGVRRMTVRTLGYIAIYASNLRHAVLDEQFRRRADNATRTYPRLAWIGMKFVPNWHTRDGNLVIRHQEQEEFQHIDLNCAPWMAKRDRERRSSSPFDVQESAREWLLERGTPKQ